MDPVEEKRRGTHAGERGVLVVRRSSAGYEKLARASTQASFSFAANPLLESESQAARPQVLRMENRR